MKIVGAKIRTLSLQVHFTTVGTYDGCEKSFSKYEEKNPQKRTIITVNGKTIVKRMLRKVYFVVVSITNFLSSSRTQSQIFLYSSS